MSGLDLTEAQIAVHGKEEGYFQPPKKFIEQANLKDPDVDKRFALDKFPKCFDEYAEMLTWYKKWDKTLDSSNPPFWKWFVGGKINASFNCLDRHLPKSKDKPAYIFVPEPENEPDIVLTYQELHKRVNEFAVLLRDFCGLKMGDRVTIHMPLVPELPITMLACARLGVIHSVVFGGFSGVACGQRIADSQSRVLISMDCYYRSGGLIDHKEKADLAVETAKADGQKIDKVLVWRRYPGKYNSKTPMVQGRDFFVDDVLKKYANKSVEPEQMDATDPLFIM